jgi:hypothetical protein
MLYNLLDFFIEKMIWVVSLVVFVELMNTKPLKRRRKLIFIVDATPMNLDYNVKRKHRSKKYLQKRNLK